MKVYTRRGDDGTTGLLYGGRVTKNAPAIRANGAIDEAQAAIGVARARAASGSARSAESAGWAEAGGKLDTMLVGIERDLWVLMADVALNPDRRDKGKPGQTLVTADMVTALETAIDDISARFEPPREFTVPGEHPVSAALDLARTVVRRAERDTLGAVPDDSHALAYLNRCSDLLWTLARWVEGDSLLAKDA